MTKKNFEVNEKGALGLLALGDIGLIQWRRVKHKEKGEKDSDEKK